MSEDQKIAENDSGAPVESTIVYRDLRAKHGHGFRTQWVLICRTFGFDPATTVAIYGVAARNETEIERRNDPVSPRPKVEVVVADKKPVIRKKNRS